MTTNDLKAAPGLKAALGSWLLAPGSDPERQEPGARSREPPLSQEPGARSPEPPSRQELELLCLCVATPSTPAIRARIRELAEDKVDWEVVRTAACAHGILALLHRRLAEVCPDLVPGAVLAELGRIVQSYALTNLRLAGELVGLLGRLEAAGIPAIPFKGPVLGQTIYWDLALRKPGDLDFLIRSRDRRAVLLRMPEWGYTLRTPIQPSGRPVPPHIYEYGFHRDEGRLQVELRWRLTRPHLRASLDLGSLWQRSVEIRMGGRTIRVLSPEDHLLVLCMHGTKHCWARLMWLRDVAQLLVAHPDLNWEQLWKRAARIGCRRPVLLGLALARDLLQSPLPEDAKARLERDPKVTRLARDVASEILNRSVARDAGCGPSEVDAAVSLRRLDLPITERLVDRVSYQWMRLPMRMRPNERDRAIVKLPERLSFLYYPLRLVRLALKRLLA